MSTASKTSTCKGASQWAKYSFAMEMEVPNDCFYCTVPSNVDVVQSVACTVLSEVVSSPLKVHPFWTLIHCYHCWNCSSNSGDDDYG